MSKNARDRRPYIKPVTRIELSEKNTTLRWILIVLLLAIAAAALCVGLISMLNTEPGWQKIEASTDEINCSREFQFYYDLGAEGSSATAEAKLLTALYSDATEKAYMIFSAHDQKDGVKNVRYLNDHINEFVTLDETLYKALELVSEHENRHIFMAPVYVEYNRIFSSGSEPEAKSFDPAANSEIREYVAELASYASNTQMISLELLGDNQVRLNVSEAYLAFAEEVGIETFVDFGWMSNAFIADYIADILVGEGYTRGYLVSYDGFTRNLDSRGEMFHQNILDREDGITYVPAVMSYSKPVSMVMLRNYPMTEEDQWHYYEFSDGSVASVYVDPTDGLSKAATNDLIAYSYDASGCAEVLLRTIPAFIADGFDESAMMELKQDGIYAIWSQGSELRYNDQSLILELGDEATLYTAICVE